MTKLGLPAVPGERVVQVDEAKVVALKQAGITNKAIAERFRISLTRVGKILTRHGVKGRP
jgi:hypothetical protein